MPNILLRFVNTNDSEKQKKRIEPFKDYPTFGPKRTKLGLPFIFQWTSNENIVEIGSYFRIKGSTVSAALKGVETKIKRDNNFQKEVEETKAIICEDKP